jgi:hypothetical protein
VSLLDALQFRVGLDMRGAQQDLAGFASQAKSVMGGIGRVAAGLGVGMAAIGAGIAAGAAAIKTVMDAGSEMEAFESRLTTLMGSSSAAKARMAELFDFASTTPFEVGPIVAAETTLRGFGAAAEELMPGLIDFSATLGADLAQSALDFGKAWNQGATGLESDTARVLRKQIELRTGMDATKMSLADFRAAMLETLNEGMFAGGAEKLSKTFSGMVANLEDEWSGFKREVADAGLFNNMKAVLAATLDYLKEHREETQKLADLVSGGLWWGFKVVAYTIASMVDMTANLIWGFSSLVGIAYKLNEAVQSGVGDTLLSMADAAEALGQGKAADALEGLAMRLLTAGHNSRQLGDAALQLAADMPEVGASVAAINEIFAEGEKLAKGMGEEIAGIKAPPAAEVVDDKAAKARAKADAERMEEALNFAAEMTAIGRTALQEEQAQYAERMGMLLDFHEEGLIVGKLFADTRLGIEQEYTAAVDAMRQEAAEKDAERRRSYASTIIDGVSGLLGTLQGLFDQSNEEQKAAYKAFGLTQIAISTAVGIQKAFADYGWPLGIAPAALVTASGIAQGAAVLQAHQGTGPVYAHQGRGPAPDERDVRMLRTEPVLNSQAGRALGAQGVEALNSGRMPGAGELVINLGRTQTREVIREELRSGETQLRRYVSGQGAVAGFSGARAVA